MKGGGGVKDRFKSVVFTIGNPACRVCEYSGYANICALLEKGRCPQVDFIKTLKTRSARSHKTRHRIIVGRDMY